MKRTLTAIVTIGMAAQMTQAATLVNEHFTNSVLDTNVWNQNTALLLNTGNQNVRLTTFGGGFAAAGNTNNGVLNSGMGYASLDVSPLGTNVIAGNWQINKGAPGNAANALVRIDLSTAVAGEGTYEMVWNNTTNGPLPFTMRISGWSGTIQTNQTIWIKNGNTGNANWHFGTADGAANVNFGDNADGFGFWINNSSGFALVDNVFLSDGLVQTPLFQNTVAYEKFDGTNLNPAVWNNGGGFTHNTNSQDVLLSTFGTAFGKRGNTTLLNSTVGYASFRASADGTNEVDGNFQVTVGDYANTANAVLRINLAGGSAGAGSYEAVWNNTTNDLPFEMPLSGLSGTVSNNSTLWIKNSDVGSKTIGIADATANVNLGDAANQFGFWLANSNKFARIDNVIISSSLTPGIPVVVASPTLSVSNAVGSVVLNWQGGGFKLQQQTVTLSGGLGSASWTDYALPDGTNPPVTVPIAVSGARFFRLINQ